MTDAADAPLGVTMGDAGGVGPEIALRACADGDLPEDAVVFGDLCILEHCGRRLGLPVAVHSVEDLADLRPDALNVRDMGLLSVDELAVGRISKACGAAALKYVREAAERAIAGELRAIVTLPMNKQATRLTHPWFSGHTGFIARLCGAGSYAMMLAVPEVLVTHVSTHVALREAVDSLNAGRILEVIGLTWDAVQRLGRCRRIAVMGLNPHAGEGGAFGTEEIEHIRPAVEAARQEGVEAVGPLPPDAVFARALGGEFGAVVCMYHDQGHIPVKMVRFEEGVNVTLGLPIVRTSVDHGTAFDIAWQGAASTRSFVNACRLADRLRAAQKA
jgi:4-hydroxythreonine-4-phosphate dehydrogenase